MKVRLLFFCCMVTCCSSITSSSWGKEDDQWSTVTVLEDQGFIVHCKVRKKVALIETDWLSLEFENQTDKPIHIKIAEFEITQQRTAIGTNRKIAGGILCRGQFKELLSNALDPVRGDGGVLPARSKRTQSEYLIESAGGSTLRRLPTPAGDHMQLAVKLLIEFADGRKLSTAADGVSVDLQLLPWNEDTVLQARKRLRNMLRNPNDTIVHYVMVGRLLEIKAVSSDLTSMELVNGIRNRKYDTGSMTFLIDFVKNNFPSDPAWLKYQEDMSKANQVLKNPNLWDKSYVEPVALLYQSYLHGNGQCLNLLHQHGDDWKADKEIAKRLSQATRKRFPMLDKKLEFMSKDEMQKWTWGIGELAKCGDQAMLPLMRQGLDDKTEIHNIKHFANSDFGNPPPPLRVCDETLVAIHALLNDDIKKLYTEAGYTHVMNSNNDNNAEMVINSVNDKLIANLKKRLDQLGK